MMQRVASAAERRVDALGAWHCDTLVRLRNILLRLRADELTAVAGAENSVAEEQVNRATLFELEPVKDFASDDLELAEIEACLARLRNGTRNPKSVESSRRESPTEGSTKSAR